ncbi:hypothetical protein BO70DRAFT_122107 [Aspergillus heteromorphus CBS 117.55]|uniref:Uncharacterized protein n=1 Tax=Aspergillus heteromorphus CBS 117.55 TaxID=1448321 RepID=A0A317VBK6_9EURO|nr:uncharacterized protein BO70DRAFT_122107 [Aspergillus heteromorphus CBS 117.55]PWY71734.1 hypothetical protein BO70DRAFT_122107 [Aspergillus heteromorphus CBS 117.55]
MDMVRSRGERRGGGGVWQTIPKSLTAPVSVQLLILRRRKRGLPPLTRAWDHGSPGPGWNGMGKGSEWGGAGTGRSMPRTYQRGKKREIKFPCGRRALDTIGVAMSTVQTLAGCPTMAQLQ